MMDKTLNETNNNNFENDWGLFIDLENAYLPNKNFKVVEKIYYTFDDYECEYNKKLETENKKMEMEMEMEIQNNSHKYSASQCIFHFTTILITSTITYCILCLL